MCGWKGVRRRLESASSRVGRRRSQVARQRSAKPPSRVRFSASPPFRPLQQPAARMAVMSAHPISRFPVPTLADLPPDLRARIEAVAEKTGFVPNVFLALAHRPDEWRAFVAYHDALMEKESGLSKAEREMIVVATSAENDCLYCVVAHGAIVRIRTKDAQVADQIAVDWRKADITPRQKAMLAFAVKLAVQPSAVEEADFDALRADGFSDEDAWDIGAVTALFALSNRIAHLTAIR